MYKKIFMYLSIIIIIVIFAIIGLKVYSNAKSNKNEENDIKEKVEKEVEFLDREIIAMMNRLNNLEGTNKNTQTKNTDQNKSSNSDEQNSSDNSSETSESGTGNESLQNDDGAVGVSKSEEKKSSEASTEIVTTDVNSILQIDKNTIDWTELQKDMEKIKNAWAIITIDLNSINVEQQDIFIFNENIDNALIYLKNKDKKNSLISIANQYSLLSKYKAKCSIDNIQIKILEIKSDVLSAYALLENAQWENIYSLLDDADKKNFELLNSADSTMKDNKNMQKIYVYLKDFIKSAKEKNVDLSYMKYFYLIEELKNL